MEIKQLQDLIAKGEESIAAHVAAGENDAAHEESGRVEAYRQMLVDKANALVAENKRIREEAALANGGGKKALRTVGERFLGARDEFRGLELGYKAKVRLTDAISGLTTPQQYDNDLPLPVAGPMGVIDTLPKGTVDGDEHYFKTPALTNAAAGWTTGTKPESALAWTPDVAHLETIAHWIPIPKMTARRYQQLQNTVDYALMLGLAITKAKFAVAGANTSGIVGLTKQTGILTYTQAAKENLYDTVVNMEEQVRIGSGFAPNCVALPSRLISSLKTAKGEDGHYLYPEIVQNGTIDGLTIVEDNNLVTAGDTTTYGALVYFNGAAQWNTADNDEVTIGLVDKQFVQNEYTLLAEGTYALKCQFPAAVCHCASVA